MSHAVQLSDHFLRLCTSHHLAHRYARIEAELIRRVQAYAAAEGLHRLTIIAYGGLQLPHQIPLTSLLLSSAFMLYNLPQIRNSLCRVAGVKIIIGHGIVPFLACSPVNGIAPLVSDDILCVIQPSFFNIAFCEPRPCPAVDGRLCGIEARHIGKRRGSLIETSGVELRASHQQPCLPEERIVFPPAEPLHIARRLAAVAFPLRPPLDAVQLDGLLTFLYGPVIACLAKLPAVLVGHSIQWYLLSEVVCIAVFLLQRGIYICQRSIIICVIACIEGMPPARGRSVFLR